VMKGKLQFNLRRNRGLAGFIRIAPAMVASAALALAAPAFAQSADGTRDAASVSGATVDTGSAFATSADEIRASGASVPSAGAADVSASSTFAPTAGATIIAPDSGYGLPPPDGGSLADPSSSSDAVAVEDATSGDASSCDSSASAVPPIDLASPFGGRSPSSGIAPVAAADRSASASSHSGCDRVGDTETEDESKESGDKVLEVPQAIPSPDVSSGDGGNQSVQGNDAAPPDEVGSVDDYQDEQDMGVMGVYVVPVPTGPPVLNPPFRAGTFGTTQAPANPPYRQSGVPTFRLGASRIPFADGMNSAIMPTSPMYPRGIPVTQGFSPMVQHNFAPIPGGWWNRAR